MFRSLGAYETELSWFFFALKVFTVMAGGLDLLPFVEVVSMGFRWMLDYNPL